MLLLGAKHQKNIAFHVQFHGGLPTCCSKTNSNFFERATYRRAVGIGPMFNFHPKYFMGFMNFCSHDPGAALVKIENGSFEYIFAEEGFLSRRKKSYQFPIRSIEYCLNHFGIKIDQVDRFILDYMNEKTFFRTSNNYRLLAGDFIRSKMKINPERISFIKSHHLAHAYTAFYPSGFEDATVIIVDGLGSNNQTHSIYSANKHNGIKLLHQQSGTGIGSIYSMVTKILGFASGEEGKTMGRAP